MPRIGRRFVSICARPILLAPYWMVLGCEVPSSNTHFLFAEEEVVALLCKTPTWKLRIWKARR
jgi:hypothetical protein